MLLVQPLISYEFPKLLIGRRRHKSRRQSKMANMRQMCVLANLLANQRLASQSAMTSIGLYNLARCRSTSFSSHFISALLDNYYEFFYAVKMCFKSNKLRCSYGQVIVYSYTGFHLKLMEPTVNPGVSCQRLQRGKMTVTQPK